MDPIDVRRFPQLERLCWNIRKDMPLDAEAAFGLYEAHWRQINEDDLSVEEATLVEALAEEYGNGLINA